MYIDLITKAGKKRIFASFGENLLEVLLTYGVNIPSDCGGHGTCGKCKVQLVNGTLSNVKPDENGYVLACKAYVNSNCTIKTDCLDLTFKKINIENTEIAPTDEVSIAFDLGTTTLAFSLVNVTKKSIVETQLSLNKQSKFGADVISRISSANDGHLYDLHSIIIKELNNSISYFKEKYKLANIKTVTISGNTTMLHLFMNVSPRSIGVAPYVSEFLDTQIFNGNKLNINAEKIILLPSISAFVGADITSGVYAINMPPNSILVDLGTNGEIIYRDKDNYYATSTAAGPCLEGATIDCGVGGIPGAISKFERLNGKNIISTIDNASSSGICGAGLVDIIAALLKDKIIDETGYMDTPDNKFIVDKNIYLSNEDVRKFQLAKSAIYSGIITLLKEAGKTLEDVDNFFIAGGIGYYINVENAMLCGLIPKVPMDKINIVGNTSLIGAIKCLNNKCNVDSMEQIANNTKVIDLNSSKFFTDEYINNMMF